MPKFNIGDKVKFVNTIGGGVVVKLAGGMVYVQDETGFDIPMSPAELINMSAKTGVEKLFNLSDVPDLPSAEEARAAAEAESKAAAREAAMNRKLKAKFTGVEVDDDQTPEQLADENKRLRSQVASLKDQVKRLTRQLEQAQQRNDRAMADNILHQYRTTEGEAVVDLHIEKLTPNSEKLSDDEKHDLQLRYFRTCLNHALLYKYKKVVFIHGVGRGVLKKEILSELDQYPNIQYLDAPATLYGAGGTEVYFK